MDSVEDLRFPVGPFSDPGQLDSAARVRAIDSIASAPSQLRSAVAGLNQRQLDTRYRPEGWTVRQVVHHLPDSHLNSYIRFKWALTEDEPAIKVYEEARWAELDDYRTVPIDISLDFLDLLHRKWVMLLRSLTPEQWSRRFAHPEWGKIDLATTAGVYAWHGRHHLAHITTTAKRLGW